MCMADKEVSKKLAFMFIQEVRGAFYDNYTKTEIENAKGYSMRTFGSSHLKPRLEMYNDNPAIADNEDKANKILADMKHLKDSMVENIESLI